MGCFEGLEKKKRHRRKVAGARVVEPVLHTMDDYIRNSKRKLWRGREK